MNAVAGTPIKGPTIIEGNHHEAVITMPVIMKPTTMMPPVTRAVIMRPVTMMPTI
jgi:hypothetical protein